jgi:lipopolysaccharide exporter
MWDLRRQAIAGVKWTTISKVMTALVQVFQVAILAHLLAPEDFGLMAMVTIVVGFAQAFGDMGVSNAIIHRQDATHEQLSSLYWVNILTGVLLFITIYATTPLIVFLFTEPRLGDLIPWVALVFLITPVGQQFQVLLEKELQFDRLTTIEVAASAASAGVAFAAAWSGEGVYSLVWATLTASGVQAVALAIMGWRRWRPSLRLRSADLKGYLSFGAYQMGERSINYLGWRLDKILIGNLMGAQALGYYQIAYELMLRPFYVLNPVITRVAFPVFSRIQTDDERLRSGYLEVTSLIASLMMPTYWVLMVLAEPFVMVLLGPNWQPIVHLFQILCLLGFIYSIGNPLGTVLLAKGRADIGFSLNVLMFVLYGFAVWFGSSKGMEGIAWALVIATAGVLFPVGLWIRWFLIGLKPVAFLASFGYFFLMASGMGILVHLLRMAIGGQGPVNELTILSAAGAGIYLMMLLLWKRPFLYRVWQMLRD